MKEHSLNRFVEGMRKAWSRHDADLIVRSQELVEEFVRTSGDEPLLVQMSERLEESRELYRDSDHGFILVAYTERRGRYRPPHDHGRGWVIYAVQRGEIEMRTFDRESTDGPGVIIRETYRMKAGESRIYLPGDIHDTRCLSDSVLVLRLTSLDLKAEKAAGRMQEYEVAK